ncbi:MAG: RCC1 domain-containing protein [Polyangiales bacterium]
MLDAPAGEVAEGYVFTCARLRSGGVNCWGADDNGQLGDRAMLLSSMLITTRWPWRTGVSIHVVRDVPRSMTQWIAGRLAFGSLRRRRGVCRELLERVHDFVARDLFVLIEQRQPVPVIERLNDLPVAHFDHCVAHDLCTLFSTPRFERREHGDALSVRHAVLRFDVNAVDRA